MIPDRLGIIGLIVFIACTVLWGQCGGIHLAHGQDIPCANTTDFIEQPPKQWSYDGTECQAPAREFCDCTKRELVKEGNKVLIWHDDNTIDEQTLTSQELQKEYENCLMTSVAQCRNSQDYERLKSIR